MQEDVGQCSRTHIFPDLNLTCLLFEWVTLFRQVEIVTQKSVLPMIQDISAEHVWPLLGEVKAKYLLLEGANPRHRRDVQCFEMAVRKGYFKSHQAGVPPSQTGK